MRVLVVDTYYPAFLASEYASHQDRADVPYADQLRSLLDRSFGTSDAYSEHFRALGHQAEETVVNCLELQLQWAIEHGGVPLQRALMSAQAAPGRVGLGARRALLRRIAQAQISAFGPDVVYVQDLWFFGRHDLDAIRASGVVVAGQIASVPPSRRLLEGYDVIFTSFPHYVERFHALGIDSEYLRIGFDERLIGRVPADPKAERTDDLVFVGGVDPGGGHRRGTALLEELSASAPLQVWGYGAEDLAAGSRLRHLYRGQAWGLDMYRILARARIVLNRHIDAAEGYANNMRLYEATGMGALLLTEAAPNLSELFEPGREVVSYEGVKDLVEKVHHYLAHEQERLTIARAGQARTLRDHTYLQRIDELAGMLQNRIPVR
jgi:spore maturation protein CgeB